MPGFRLAMTYAPPSALTVTGGGKIPIQRTIGPLEIAALLIDMREKSFAIGLDLGFELGPIAVAAYELGLRIYYEDGAVEPFLHGLGLSMDTDVVKLGRVLRGRADEQRRHRLRRRRRRLGGGVFRALGDRRLHAAGRPGKDHLAVHLRVAGGAARRTAVVLHHRRRRRVRIQPLASCARPDARSPVPEGDERGDLGRQRRMPPTISRASASTSRR